MPSARLSTTARRFLAAHIHSIMQLELLLLLQSDDGRAWTAQDASRELRAPVGWVETQLVDFAGQRVLAYDQEGSAFRFEPAGPHAAAVAELASAYPARRTSIIKLIFAPPSRDAESFSDAFRLRDED